MNREAFQRIISEKVLVRYSDKTPVIATIDGKTTTLDWIFDFRSVVLDPHWLDTYADLFWEKFENQLPFQVSGLETASIPLVTAIVMKGLERKTPVNGFYLRKSRKREGLLKVIEGTPNEHPVILVDDLMNTGGSVNKQITILHDFGLKVSEVFAVVLFRTPEAYNAITKQGVQVRSLFTLVDFNMKQITTPSNKLPNGRLEQVWKFSKGNPSFEFVHQKSTPIADATHLYFGTDDGTFIALNKSSGEIAWEYKLTAHPQRRGIMSSPTLHNNKVYFGGYDGTVYALDCKSGKKIWTYEDADWVGSSPAISKKHNRLFIGLEFGLYSKQGGIVALDATTGTKIWFQSLPDLVHCTPLHIPEEKMVVIGSNGGVCYAFNDESGALVWQQRGTGEIKSSFAYDPIRRLILFGAFDSTFYALDAQTGDTVFTYPTRASIYSTPLVIDNLVYIASLDKHLYALNLDTGTCQWKVKTSGRIFASPVQIEDLISIGSNDGVLRLLDSKTGNQHTSFQCSERIVNAVNYDSETKYIYVPTVANEVYCLKEKPK